MSEVETDYSTPMRAGFEDTYKSNFFKNITTDLMYRVYVGENTYNQVKNAGPYKEVEKKGVRMLTEHSSKRLSNHLVIKVPRYEEE